MRYRGSAIVGVVGDDGPHCQAACTGLRLPFSLHTAVGFERIETNDERTRVGDFSGQALENGTKTVVTVMVQLLAQFPSSHCATNVCVTIPLPLSTTKC
eukprot:SAG31_NODE_36798_length_310_cov_0.734597_1_plen_98_part_10